MNVNIHGIEKCVWKVAAESDEKKRAEGRTDVTFNEHKICFSCNGYDTACPNYTSNYQLEIFK